jgi:DNA-binding winged helix-turn-helix (wHTH) protein/predicted ATPase
MNVEQGNQIVFGPFRLDSQAEQLWREAQAVALRPKPLAVLQYLAQRPGQVVSSKELLKTIWTGTIVTKAVVKECVRTIRNALEEDASIPRYIETVGREGYRFLGGAANSQYSVVSSVSSQLTSHSQSLTPILVGREAELSRLHGWLAKALSGERQIVFVTGEPGIGKTALIDRFREQLRTNDNLTLSYGQCVEQYGGCEVYLPILEAMGRLCREENGKQIVTLLRRYAPTWLVQLSGVIDEAEIQALRLQVQGATQQRMLREMAEALEQLTRQQPLLLILEDLHWSDQATVELLSYLAQRRERAHFLVRGTYRPAALVLGNHSLKAIKQELQAKRQCGEGEVRVELLSTQEVSEYLVRRFLYNQFSPDLAAEIHRRTEGNALFMVNIVEEFIQQGCIVKEQELWTLKGDLTQVNVPDTLRQLIERQVQQCTDDEQRLLEVASVAGAEFAVAAIAAALKQEIDEVEEVCEDLTGQGHFLVERGVSAWPDGTVSGRYAFRHALYQNVLYERIAEARRVRLHRSIGERLAASYGERAREIAAELAVHFERGRDYQRAVQYLQHAGRNASRKSAHKETITHLTRGLELLKTLPDTPERAQQELTLQVALGTPLQATKGYSVPEVKQVYTRARELCRQLGETPQLFPVLWGLCAFSFVRAELQQARELGEQCLRLAQHTQAPELLVNAHHALGQVLYYLDEAPLARKHFEQCLALYDSQKHNPRVSGFVQDPGVTSLGHLAHILWRSGYPDQALKSIDKALTLAQELSHPLSLVYALNMATIQHLHRREAQLVQERAKDLMALSDEHELPFFWAAAVGYHGWALAEQGEVEEGIKQLRQSITAKHAIGSEMARPFWLALLAEAYGKAERIEEGLRVLAEALTLVDETGERVSEAEPHRLKGELTLQKFQVSDSMFQVQTGHRSQVQSRKSKKANSPSLISSPQQEAEACFLKAIDISQKQQAKSLELRATTSLARLWQQHGKRNEARDTLAKVYNWFTEGFDTKNLQEAKTLLAELNR